MEPENASSGESAIIAKLRKLLARANPDQNDNEHEREIAMRQAANLAARHSIDLGTIETDDKKSEGFGRSGRADIKPQTTEKWENTIYNAIGKIYGCKVVYDNPTNKIVIIGREIPIYITKYIANYCIISIRIEAKLQGHRLKLFGFGASSAIIETSKRMITEQSEGIVDGVKVSDSHAIVLRNNNQMLMHDATALARQIFPNMRSVSRAIPNADNQSFAAGKAHGAGLSLSQQVTRGAVPKSHRLA